MIISAFIIFLIGVIFGASIAVVIFFLVKKNNDKSLLMLKDSFNESSLDTLSKTTDQLVKTASEKLSSERALGLQEFGSQKDMIDERIKTMNDEITKLTELVNTLENRRNSQLGELKNAIDLTNQGTKELFTVASGLKETLSSKQLRGKWGERMAEDVLALSGMKEGINYTKQITLGSTGGRPDFTFKFPNGMKLNMDVKFPYENYQKYWESTDEKAREGFRKQFLSDVRAHIKDVSKREYINPEENTASCALIFIPNEGIYSFIFESDSEIITNEAIKSNIVMCSPITVISIIGLIRQAAESYNAEKNAKEIIKIVNIIKSELTKTKDSFADLGDAIAKVQTKYMSIYTTRFNMLERSMNKIESLDEK